MKNKLLALLVTVTFFGSIFSNVNAQVPRMFSYQGMVLQNGNPVTGSNLVKVSIYDSAQGGHLLFTDQYSTLFEKGLYNVSIGSVIPLPDSLDFTKPYFLGISINDGGEIGRTAILSTPYSLRSITADTAFALSSKASSGIVTKLNNIGGSITLEGAGGTTVNRTNDTIIITSIATGATGIQGIQNLDGSLTIANPNGAISNLRVSDTGIATRHIQVNAVTTAKIADAAVTGKQIAKATIDADNINGANVPTGSVLTATGGSTPVWKMVDLATNVTGVLPVNHGGTGQSDTLMTGGILYGKNSTTVGTSYPGSVGQVLTASTGAKPTWQTPSYVLSGSLIAFPDSSPRADYTYTGAADIHEGWSSASSNGATAGAWQSSDFYAGKMYCFGSPAPGIANTVQSFDFTTNQWATKSNSGFTPRWGSGAAVSGTKIYVFGGAGQDMENEAFDAVANNWSTVHQCHKVRHFLLLQV